MLSKFDFGDREKRMVPSAPRDHQAGILPSHHAVLYTDEPALVHACGPFLAEALAEGGIAVVLATSAHRSLFEGWIDQIGVDLAEAERQGRYRSLDVEEVMTHLVDVDDKGRAFASLLGEVFGDLPVGTGRVAAMGEVVAALWATGQVEATWAVERAVEDLLPRLALRRPLSGLCAYPTEAMANEADLEGLCSCHSAGVATLLSPPVPNRGRGLATRAFPSSAGGCRAARRFAVATLVNAGLGGVAEDVALVVSELATNAIRHARSPFTVTLSVFPTGIRVTVSDEAVAGRPREGLGLPVEIAHGLWIVSALSAGWGVDADRGGKMVWVDLRK